MHWEKVFANHTSEKGQRINMKEEGASRRTNQKVEAFWNAIFITV